MAQNTYTHGYSSYTIATHQRRTAEADAGFLLPYLKKTDRILDVGCGPGTITAGFAKYVPEGAVIGIDLSEDVLKRATDFAAKADLPTEGPGSVVFKQGSILEELPYPDNTFDVVFCSQVLPHLAPPDQPLQAIKEMRRVLKPGGVLASRDGMESLFYPRGFDLGRLWVQNNRKVLRKGAPESEDYTGAAIPALFRTAGFDVDNGKVKIGAGTTVFSGKDDIQFLAWRATGQLQPGDPFRQGWINAGIHEDEIQQTLDAVNKWANAKDAFFVAVQSETLGWK